MNKRSKMSDKVSDKQSVLLSAYHDGELSERRLKSCVRDIERADGSLAEQLERLQFLRGEVRRWYKQQVSDSDGSICKPDIWANIEGEVAMLAEEIALGRSEKDRWLALRSFFLNSLVAPRFSAVSAVAVVVCLLTVVAVWRVGTNSEDGEGAIYAEIEPFKRVASSSVSVSTVAVPTISVANRSSRIGPNVQSRRDANDPELRFNSSLVQRVDRDFASGGLRADGADIDWIKSDVDGGLKLFSSRDRTAPPVIWLASRRGRAKMSVVTGR